MEASPIEMLTELLSQDPEEFDIAILRSTAEEGGDPCVLCDGHLGLHAGDLAWLARDFRREYHAIRLTFLEIYDSDRDMNENNDDNNVPTHGPPQNHTVYQNLLNVTSCLLLVCPDHATAWADRKRALQHLVSMHISETRSLWEKELKFLNLVMTKHTKAPTSWFHRKFVLQKITTCIIATNKEGSLSKNNSAVEDLLGLTKDEIKLCVRVAARYPKNYYAWTHRIHALQMLYKLLFDGDTRLNITSNNQQFESLLQEEWSSTVSWLRTHVSDHSAAHFGGLVLRLVLKIHLDQDGGTSRKRMMNNKAEDGNLTINDELSGISLAEEALAAARHLVEAYPTHEVLWIFRRICSHAFLTYLVSSAELKQSLHYKPELQVASDDDAEVTDIRRSGIQGSMTDFWQANIVDQLVVVRSPGNEGKDSAIAMDTVNEAHLEALQTQMHRLSYVAWTLEYLWSIGSQRNAPVASFFGLKRVEMAGLRSKVQASLRDQDVVPCNVYRVNIRKHHR